MHIIAIIFVLLSFILMFSANERHKEETGVDGPTRKQLRYIRKQARKRGISDAEYYEIWLKNKQKRAGIR